MSRLDFLTPLTKREQEILHLLTEGLSNRRIAEELSLTIRTVKFHTGNIYSRIGVRSRSEATVWVWRQSEVRRRLED